MDRDQVILHNPYSTIMCISRFVICSMKLTWNFFGSYPIIMGTNHLINEHFFVQHVLKLHKKNNRYIFKIRKITDKSLLSYTPYLWQKYQTFPVVILR